MSLEWIFDPSPPSGKRRGGNAAEYSFSGQIDTLVREVVQNSLDASVGQEQPVQVTFRLLELGEDGLEALQSAMSWNTLVDNLRAVPDSRGGDPIKRAVEVIESQRRIRVLIVEDRGTKGLIGGEERANDNELNSFCALVRDELYSDKEDSDAAGSFGLGKSLLWAYSSLKTVLFSSVSVSPPRGFDGLRFIGRACLPFHHTEEDGDCAGDGWLGVRHDLENNWTRAESVWGEQAEHVARDCQCARSEEESGLSIAIVGFSEPGEADRGLEELHNSIIEAGLESFWPAIVRGRLRVESRVEVDGEVRRSDSVDPMQADGYRQAAELLLGFYSGTVAETDRLENAGARGLKWVEIEVPERMAETPHPESRGRVPVLVQLLEEKDASERVRDRIFRFRRPGMVVRQNRGGNLSVNARPYVAVLPAGLACGSSTEDHRVEHFLRASEPPEHNIWIHDTRAIKQFYRSWGTKAKLDRFDNAVIAAIRALVSPPEKKGGELPRALLKYLRFGDKGGGGQPRFLSVTRQKAWPQGHAWNFHATCRRIRPDGEPWFVRVRLAYAVDGGGSDDVHAISKVHSERASRCVVIGGVGYVEFAADVQKAEVRGTTDSASLPIVGTRAAVRLRIDGESGGIPDA
jgi:hypothetical protein